MLDNKRVNVIFSHSWVENTNSSGTGLDAQALEAFKPCSSYVLPARPSTLGYNIRSSSYTLPKLPYQTSSG